MTHESAGFNISFINVPIVQIYLAELAELTEAMTNANVTTLRATLNDAGTLSFAAFLTFLTAHPVFR